MIEGEDEIKTEENVINPNSNQPYYERCLKHHSDTISQIVFNPNNKSVASCSNDNTILIWDLLNSASKPKKLSGHKSLVNDLAMSPTGFSLASASSDQTVRVWSHLSNDEETQCLVFKHNSAPVKSVDFSCDSRLLCTGSDDKSVRILNVTDKKLSATLSSHTNWVKCVRFSQDAKLIASSSDDKTVKLWDVNKKTLNYTFSNVHNGVINAVRFHPDNSLIGTACFDKKVRLFDVRSKQLVQVYDQHKKPVTSLAFHPQGIYMASTSYDETVRIFDLRNGQIVYTLTGHEGCTTSVNFTHNGEYLATGGLDALIILWRSNMNLDNPNNADYYNFHADNIDNQKSNVLSYKFTENKTDSGVYFKNMLTGHQAINTINENFTSGNNYNQQDISEELSKVFEKMVYQLELITRTFKNFENRLSHVEDVLENIKGEDVDDERINNIVYQKQILENEINQQIVQMNTMKNETKNNTIKSGLYKY